MTEKPPPHIVCAIRGGAESRAVAARAIELALQTNARLTFVNVVDAEFLGYSTISPLSLVYRELEAMGRFALTLLVDRARRAGVRQVDCVVRKGNVRTELLRFIAEAAAGTLVIMKPTQRAKAGFFGPAEFEVFAAELKRQTEVDIVQVDRA